MGSARTTPRGTRGTLGARPYEGAIILLEVAERTTEQLLRRRLVPRAEARRIGLVVALRLADLLGGSQQWIPKARPSRSRCTWLDMRARDAAIFRAYNGRNMTEIRTRWGLTPAAVHLIVTKMRGEIRRAGRKKA